LGENKQEGKKEEMGGRKWFKYMIWMYENRIMKPT
jgi:hypothetical protein